jgi:hypothetical protein
VEAPHIIPLKINIPPGLPSYSFRIGYKSITNVAANQFINVPYGIIFGLIISAIYSQMIGPRVQENVPLITITQTIISISILFSSNKKLTPTINKHVQMITPPP